MPVFTYRGTNRTGASVAGEMTASSKTELQSLLRRQQITATKMSEKGKEFNLPTFGGGVNAKELAVFTRQFSVMIDAGLPLVQCLEILGKPAGEQDLPEGADGHALGGGRRQHALRSHEAIPQGLRRAVLQHGGSGGDGRYSGHHSAAPLHVHRKEREIAARGEVRHGLPHWRLDHRRRPSSSCCCGKWCRCSRRCSPAWAWICRCLRRL